MRLSNLRSIVICLVPLVISGCAFSGKAYEGSQKPQEEIAVIHGDQGGLFGTSILINWIDAQQMHPSVVKVEVLPGERIVTFYFWDGRARFPTRHYAFEGKAKFTAEAGHQYQIEGEGGWSKDPSPIKLRVIDTETKNVVWQGQADGSKPSFILTP